MVKKSRFWNVMVLSSLGAGLASALVVPYLSDNEDVQTLGVAGGVVFFCTMMISGFARDSYQARAVDRYNIHVLGLPLP